RTTTSPGRRATSGSPSSGSCSPGRPSPSAGRSRSLAHDVRFPTPGHWDEVNPSKACALLVLLGVAPACGDDAHVLAQEPKGAHKADAAAGGTAGTSGTPDSGVPAPGTGGGAGSAGMAQHPDSGPGCTPK